MSDYFSEFIVKQNTPHKVKFLRIILIILCVVTFPLLFVPYIGFIVWVLLVLFTWMYWRNTDIEWEYTLVDKSMYVDKIMQKAKRKRIAEYDLTKLEVVAPVESYHVKEYDRRNLKEQDFSSLNPETPKHAMIIMHNNELIKIIFEPSERMLREMRDAAPRKIFNE